VSSWTLQVAASAERSLSRLPERVAVAIVKFLVGPLEDPKRIGKPLQRELAEYRSPAERHELDAIMARHTAEEIAPIERIILRQSRPGGLAYHG